ncbi:hypothetical protein ACLRE7_00795 [Mycoplasmopsis meleagridis]|uniref:hypothetical protein n=1 Tax=Mycoplasmopsis meleagridis TaxID=29561 RepID=UPI003A83AFF3
MESTSPLSFSNVDDNKGSLNITFKIYSSKNSLNDIVSSTSKTISITGFLTILQKQKNDIAKKVDSLTSLSEKTRNQYKEQIKSAKDLDTANGIFAKAEFDDKREDTKNKVNSLSYLSKVEKEKLNKEIDFINKESDLKSKLEEARISDYVEAVDQVYSSLNPKQKNDLKTNIKKQSTSSQAKQIFDKTKPLNDRMKTLRDKLADTSLENLKNNAGYKNATEESKNKFDTTLSKIINLFNSNTDNLESGSNSLDNLFGKDNNGGEFQNSLLQLNGFVVDFIKKYVDAEKSGKNDLLTENEKQSVKNRLLSKDLTSYSNLEANKRNLSIIKDLTKELDDNTNNTMAYLNKQKSNAYNEFKIKYSNLNNSQSTSYLNLFKKTDYKDFDTKINNPANKLNDKMKELHDYVQKIYSELTKQVVINFDPNSNNSNFSSTKWNLSSKEAQDNFKNAYDLVIKDFLNSTTGLNKNENEIDSAKNNLENLYSKLTGDQVSNDIDKKIDGLNNLTNDQRMQLKKIVANSKNANEANSIFDTAKKLNDNIKKLKDTKDVAESQKLKDNYKSKPEDKKKQHEQALNETLSIITNFEKDNLSNKNLNDLNGENTKLEKEINKILEAINLLNDPKDVAIDRIKQFNDLLLLPASKQKYNDEIQKVIDSDQKTLPNKLNEILNKAYDEAKNKALDKLTKENTLVSQHDLEEFKKTINSSSLNTDLSKNPDQTLLDNLASAKEVNDKTREILDFVDKLQNINNNQKNSLKESITNANSDQLDDLKNKANEANNQMLNLMNNVLDKLKRLTGKNNITDVKDQSEKSLTNYKFADDTTRNKLDETLKKAIDLLDKQNGDKNYETSTIQAVSSNLNNSFDLLNGDNNLKLLKDQIDKLDKLSSDQKQALNDHISKLGNKQEATDYANKVSDLNSKVNYLESIINKSNITKTTQVYTNSNKQSKEAFDKALEAANKIKESFASVSLSDKSIDDLNNQITNLDEAINNLNNASQNLDGVKEEFKNKIKNDFTLLTDEDKTKIIDIINQVPDEQFDDVKKEEILNSAFELAKDNAKDQISKMYLSDSEKQTLTEEINNAIIDKDSGEKIDKNLQIIVDKRQISSVGKEKSANEIKGLNNLNDSQKNALIDKLANSSSDQANEILNEAKALDSAMAELVRVTNEEYKELAYKDLDVNNFDKSELINKKYLLSDTDKKDSYDSSLMDVVNNYLDKNSGQNKTLENINQVKEALENSFSQLNGENNLVQLKNKIDNLNNLAPKTKEDFKNNLSNVNTPINSLDTANRFIDSATKLNDELTKVNSLINDENNVKNSDNYLSNEADKKAAYDQAIKILKQYKDNLTISDLSSASSADIDRITKELGQRSNDVEKAVKNLITIEEAAKNTIDNFDNLTDEQKNNLKKEIDSLPKQKDKTEVNRIIEKGFASAKENAKNEINTLDNLTSEQKDTYKDLIDSTKLNPAEDAIPDSQISEVLDAAKAGLTLEEKAKRDIDKLEYLNDAQKASLKSQIQDNVLDHIDLVLDKAKKLNQAMKDLKDEATEEVKYLTKNPSASYDSKDAKIDVKYLATSNKNKSAYDKSLTNAIQALDKTNGANLTLDEVNSLKEKLIAAYNNLDDLKVDHNKQKINNTNLTNEQKDQFNDRLDKLTTQEEKNNLINKAKELSDAKNKLIATIQKAEETKLKDIYIYDHFNKNNFDKNLELAKKQLEILNQPLTSLDDANLDKITNDVLNRVDNLEDSINNLDGLRDKLKDLVDNSSSLSAKQKNEIKDLINNLPKETTAQNEEKIRQQIFDKAKEYANVVIQNSPYLSQDEVNKYKELVENAPISTDKVVDKNINDALQKALEANKVKKEAIENIDSKNNLNDNQKAVLKNEVILSDSTNANSISQKADRLDNLMANYKNIKKVDKNSPLYTNSSSNDQKTYDDLIALRDKDVAKNGANLNEDDLNKRIENLNSAIQNLGREVNNAKENASQAIDNLNNLTTEQKEAVKEKLDDLSKKDDINKLVQDATKLDDEIGKLKDYVINSEKVKETNSYTKSDNTKQSSYDQAIDDAKKKLEELAKNPEVDSNNKKIFDLSANTNKATEANKNVHDAISKLDGDNELKTAKENAISEINKLTNLNTNQKNHLITQVDNSTTQEEISQILEAAKKLEETVKKINDSLTTNKDKTATNNYTSADKDKQNNFDKALDDAKNVVDQTNGSATIDNNKLEEILNNLNNAASNLNGDSNLNSLKAAIDSELNNLNSLNDKQKADYKTKL